MRACTMCVPSIFKFYFTSESDRVHFFADGGAVGNPPIKIFNLPSGYKTLKVLSINNGDLNAPNIHLKDSTKGLTQIQPGGGHVSLHINATGGRSTLNRNS